MPRCADQELKVHDFTEEDMVRLAQQGNAAAFEQLYRRHSGRVYALCLRIVSKIFHLAAPASHQCCASEAT